LDTENNGNRYASIYKIGGTIYEVKTTFAGMETLNKKVPQDYF